jgi:phosphoribosylglycinamide formyltransferase-1
MNPAGRIGVLISGRGSHLRNLINRCSQKEIAARIAVVISNKADAPGLQYARDTGIETIVLSHKDFADREHFDARIVELLKERAIDLVCLAGYMRLLTSVFIKAFPLKIMNVHPALLPAFPGLHSQKQAIDYGVKVTGVTVHFVDEGLDSGPIIVQTIMPVEPNDTEETLSERLLPVEHQAYAEAVRLFFENRLKVEGRKVLIL